MFTQRDGFVFDFSTPQSGRLVGVFAEYFGFAVESVGEFHSERRADVAEELAELMLADVSRGFGIMFAPYVLEVI